MAKKKKPEPKDYVLPKKDKKTDQETAYDRISEGLPKEAQAKMKEVKKNLDKFKDKLLSKFENYVIGITIIPPALSEDQIKKTPAPAPAGGSHGPEPRDSPGPRRKKNRKTL